MPASWHSLILGVVFMVCAGMVPHPERGVQAEDRTEPDLIPERNMKVQPTLPVTVGEGPAAHSSSVIRYKEEQK